MDSKARMRTMAIAGVPLKPNHVAYVERRSGSSIMLRHCWDNEDPIVFAAVLEAAKRLAVSRSGIVRASISIYSTRKALLDVVPYEPVRKPGAKISRAKLRMVSYVCDKHGRIVESETHAIEPLTEHVVDAKFMSWK